MERRALLRGALGGVAGTLVPRPAKAAAPVRIIDSHVHFYDPTRAQGVPWPPREDKLLYRPVLPKDYRALQLPLQEHVRLVQLHLQRADHRTGQPVNLRGQWELLGDIISAETGG